MTKSIRTRFAPSPTGYLHVGGLRNALYCYLFARQNNGKFILRIEDTDQEREVAGAAEKLMQTLNQVGLGYDEGPVLDNDQIIEKGEFGPYFQSKRLELYQKYAKQLIAEKKAYYCFCSTERLAEMRQKQQEQKQPPKYDRCCLNLTQQEIEQKLANQEKSVVRFKITDNQEVVAHDLVRGEVKFQTNELDDLVILKSDGFPTYHLAHVVDDYLMQISHVIRGEEWLPSLPKHILLWQAFGWPIPEYAHLSLLLNPDKSKLSKRQGDVAVEDYLIKGYLPEAIINFVALLGWNPGEGSEQEIFSLSELIQKFNLSHINKSGAVFNLEKLDWMNGVYLRQMSIDQLTEKCLPIAETWFKERQLTIDLALLKKIIKVEQTRLKKLTDITANFNIFYSDQLTYDPQKLIWKKSDQQTAKKNLQLALELLTTVNDNDWTVKNLELIFKRLIEENSLKTGEILWPVRYALSGVEQSPSPFELAWVLGKEKSIARIQQGIAQL